MDTNNSWQELINEAQQADQNNDLAGAKKYLDLALWKAEQHGLNSEQLLKTLEQYALFSTRRYMDDQALTCWNRFLKEAVRAWGKDSEKLLPYLDKMSEVLERKHNWPVLEQVYRQAIRLEELVSDHSDKLSKRLEQLSGLLVQLKRPDEAKEIGVRQRAIKEKNAAPPPSVHSAVTQQMPAIMSNTGNHQTLQAERRIFIGQLFTRSAIIPYDQFSQQLKVSKKLGMPIGEVLIDSGLITRVHLEAALKLQVMAREDKITVDQAGAALRRVCHENLSVEDALNTSNQTASDQQTVQMHFGSLLVDSGLIPGDTLDQVLKDMEQNQNTFAKQLVVSKALSAMIVGEALELQEEVQAGRLTTQQAIEKLKTLNPANRAAPV